MIPSALRPRLDEMFPEGYKTVVSGHDGKHGWIRVMSLATDSVDTAYVIFDSRRDVAWIQHSFTLDGYSKDAN